MQKSPLSISKHIVFFARFRNAPTGSRSNFQKPIGFQSLLHFFALKFCKIIATLHVSVRYCFFPKFIFLQVKCFEQKTAVINGLFILKEKRNIKCDQQKSAFDTLILGAKVIFFHFFIYSFQVFQVGYFSVRPDINNDIMFKM